MGIIEYFRDRYSPKNVPPNGIIFRGVHITDSFSSKGGKEFYSGDFTSDKLGRKSPGVKALEELEFSRRVSDSIDI